MTSPRKVFLAGFLSAILLGGLCLGALAYVLIGPGTATPAAATIAPLSTPSGNYGSQKVVYHVATRGSWRDREGEAWRLVAVLNNHINAVEPEEIAIDVIFQGDGIDALKRAKANPKLASALDNLRRRGVNFRVCANTLEAQKLGPGTLHGIEPKNLVQAGVAELIHLQKQGYAYIRF